MSDGLSQAEIDALMNGGSAAAEVGCTCKCTACCQSEHDCRCTSTSTCSKR